MRKLVILGGGTAGTMMANKFARALDPDEWQITIIDSSETHYYQPGFLFIPFGIYSPRDVVKPRRPFFPPGVKAIVSEVERIEPAENRVVLGDGSRVNYDTLIEFGLNNSFVTDVLVTRGSLNGGVVTCAHARR